MVYVCIRRPWGACWMVSVTERVKTLFFPPLQPRNAARRGVRGGGGGVGGVSRARFPPGPHLRGSRFSRLPPLRLPPTRRLFQTTKLVLCPGSKPSAPSPGPQALGKPRRLDHLFRLVARLISFRQATPS